MNIALVGFSGVGKSSLAKKLESEAGWVRLSCDELIEERLRGELSQYADVGEAEYRLAAWMGFPWESHSAERQKLYLLLEEQVLDEMCDRLERVLSKAQSPNIVVDTTGSCIYLDFDVLYRLKKFSHIIFLESPKSEESLLTERYFTSPKPIIWGDVFQISEEDRRSDNPEIAAIRRCYPTLLESRHALYSNLAHHRILATPEERFHWSASDFLAKLPKW